MDCLKVQYILDYPHLHYPNTLDYPNREAMASVEDLNYFTYLNFNYPNPQGVQITKDALYYCMVRVQYICMFIHVHVHVASKSA